MSEALETIVKLGLEARVAEAELKTAKAEIKRLHESNLALIAALGKKNGVG